MQKCLIYSVVKDYMFMFLVQSALLHIIYFKNGGRYSLVIKLFREAGCLDTLTSNCLIMDIALNSIFYMENIYLSQVFSCYMTPSESHICHHISRSFLPNALLDYVFLTRILALWMNF